MSAERNAVLQLVGAKITGIKRPYPTRVAIDGVSAAGKTTLADELAELVRELGRPVIRASVDDFHNVPSIRWARGRESAEGFYLDTFNYESFRSQLLDPLGPAGNRRYRTGVQDGATDLSRPIESAPPEAMLICDCIFAFRPELDDCWDFRVFVDVDHEETLTRAIQRDSAWMGTPSELEARYRQRYIPAEKHYLATVQPEKLADIVIDNRNPDAPALLSLSGQS
jgi:uridine kinase